MNISEREFLRFMSRFDENAFQIRMGGKKYQIGTGRPGFTVEMNRIPTLAELMTSTSLALGEAYMNGDIEIVSMSKTDESGKLLYHALNQFLGQMSKFATDHVKLKKLIFTSKSKNNQKKEVSSHYDIGNEFYRLWLDETMNYSCGYFKSEQDSLYQAQCQKTDYILQKLYLKEGMTLCDIGCGWGNLLMQAAKKYKVHGVGITLSEEQKHYLEEQIRQQHLEEYLEVQLLDYRDLPRLQRTFDRVVSVGMVEHVGRGNYEEFMDCAKSILKEKGLFLLHFISAMREYPGDPWIKKYIFPGGVVPSLREMLQVAGDLNLYTLDVESLRRHYNRTLLCWNENFQNNREIISDMFDDRFVRMWELYLCSCAATFQNGVIDLHQILLSNGVNNELPMVRWY